MIFLYSITTLLLLLSFLKDKEKTRKALKISYKKFSKISPAFLTMLIIISIVVYLLPKELIAEYLEDGTKFIGTLIAALLGSITVMPGFVAFPLAGILKQQGISYMTLSAFTTTLMLVGIVTFPLEKKYFGVKVAIIRIVIGFLISLIIALITGVVFGEIL